MAQEILDQITIDVVMVTDFKQFTNPDGSRILLMPFFEKTDESWWWRIIYTDTDAEWLIKKIEEGRIYIFKQ
jgi:hypothetical protein